MEREGRSNHHVTSDYHYHVVWCPKERRKVLVNAVAVRLKQLIAEVCQEQEALVEEVQVMPDQVHLLVSVDPQVGIHRLVRLIKGRSSRFLRQAFPRLKSRLPTLWTHSSVVDTTEGAPLELVKKSLEGQKRGEKSIQVSAVSDLAARANPLLDAGTGSRVVQCGPG